MSPPTGGPGGRPIRCVGFNPTHPEPSVTTGKRTRSATSFRKGIPVAIPGPDADSQSVSDASLPGSAGKASNGVRTNAPAGVGAGDCGLPVGSLVPVGSDSPGKGPGSGETLAARRRRIAAEREAAQAEAARKARAEDVNALGHDGPTRTRLGLEVLQSAWTLAAGEVDDWLTGAGGETPRNFVLRAGGGGVAGHYALKLLGYIPERPYGHAEVLAALSAAIVRAGGTAPEPPKPRKPRRKPGPKVSAGLPSAEEVERRRALLAQALERERQQPQRSPEPLMPADEFARRYLSEF